MKPLPVISCQLPERARHYSRRHECASYLLNLAEGLERIGAAGVAAPVIYSFAGFKLSCHQKRASISHFLEQKVCPSRARLVLRRYWEKHHRQTAVAVAAASY